MFCGGAAHASTGAQYTDTAVACYGCVVHFWKWFRAQQHKKWSGYYFYECAARNNPRLCPVDTTALIRQEAWFDSRTADKGE